MPVIRFRLSSPGPDVIYRRETIPGSFFAILRHPTARASSSAVRWAPFSRGVTVETEPASRFSPTTRLNDFSAAFTFKLHKLAMKLPPSLTRLWTRRPKILPARDESVVRSSAAAPEVDAIPCFASATVGIPPSPSTRIRPRSRSDLETHPSLSFLSIPTSRRTFPGGFSQLPRSPMVRSLLSLQPPFPVHPHPRRLWRTRPDPPCFERNV